MSTDQPSGPQPAQPPSEPPAEAPYYPVLNPVSAIMLNGDDTAAGTPASGSSSPSSPSSSGRGRWVALVVAGLVPILVGVAIWQFVAHSTSDPSQTVPSSLPSTFPSGLPTQLGSLPASPGASDQPQAPGTPKPVDALSPAGWTALVAAVRQQHGSSQVVQATVYPAYAVVGLPAKGGATAQFRWDGTGLTSFGTMPAVPGGGRIDMAAVKGTVVARLSQRIRGMVAHPTAWYVLLRTDPISRKPSLYVYANNDAGHGGYLLADLAGAVQRTVKW
jgi:hypothetical protein